MVRFIAEMLSMLYNWGHWNNRLGYDLLNQIQNPESVCYIVCIDLLQQDDTHDLTLLSYS